MKVLVLSKESPHSGQIGIVIRESKDGTIDVQFDNGCTEWLFWNEVLTQNE
jgi:hypothetical protein